MDEAKRNPTSDIDPMNPILRVQVLFDLKKSEVSVTGHIDNTDLCVKILAQAAVLIMNRNAAADTARMKAQLERMQAAMPLVNGNGKAN